MKIEKTRKGEGWRGQRYRLESLSMWPSFYIVVDAVDDGNRIANTVMEYSVVMLSPYAPKYRNCNGIPISSNVQ